MKTRINLLCVLVFLMMGFSVVPYGIYGFKAITKNIKWVEELQKTGDFEAVKNSQLYKKVKQLDDASEKGEKTNPLSVGAPLWLLPADLLRSHATMRNELTGMDNEIMPMSAIVILNEEEEEMPQFTWWENLLRVLSNITLFSLLTPVLFFWLIYRVNKGKVFDWTNVKVLRIMGWCMLASTIGLVLNNVVVAHQLLQVFQPQGYTLNYTEYFQVDKLLMALVPFVAAEIFAVGLKMREEQEFTV